MHCFILKVKPSLQNSYTIMVHRMCLIRWIQISVTMWLQLDYYTILPNNTPSIVHIIQSTNASMQYIYQPIVTLADSTTSKLYLSTVHRFLSLLCMLTIVYSSLTDDGSLIKTYSYASVSYTSIQVHLNQSI